MNWKFWIKKQSCMEKEIFEQAQIVQNCNRYSTAAAAAKLLQSCLTLCDPIDGSQ